jgi:hypothetical protein
VTVRVDQILIRTSLTRTKPPSPDHSLHPGAQDLACHEAERVDPSPPSLPPTPGAVGRTQAKSHPASPGGYGEGEWMEGGPFAQPDTCGPRCVQLQFVIERLSVSDCLGPVLAKLGPPIQQHPNEMMHRPKHNSRRWNFIRKRSRRVCPPPLPSPGPGACRPVFLPPLIKSNPAGSGGVRWRGDGKWTAGRCFKMVRAVMFVLKG